MGDDFLQLGFRISIITGAGKRHRKVWAKVET